jgi:hypothetical protein
LSAVEKNLSVSQDISQPPTTRIFAASMTFITALRYAAHANGERLKDCAMKLKVELRERSEDKSNALIKLA